MVRLGIRAAVMLGACGAVMAQDVVFFDDGELALVATTNPGVQEPGVALFVGGARVNDPATPGADVFDLVNFFDRVPGTMSYPLTFADIVANGYIRPLVQRGDGTTGSIGTSVVTSPAFRAAGSPLRIVQQISCVDVTLGGAERVRVQGSGSYDGLAMSISERTYPDPVVARSVVGVRCTWTATQEIVMPTPAQGRGNDCFRLVMFSSMLADVAGGVYDANYLMVEDPAGRRRTLALDEGVRNTHLLAMPAETGVGRSFALLKDTRATWNPGSPSIGIEIVRATGPGGLAVELGVQGWRLDSVDPNDDSLSVWLEWTNVPAVIAAGSVLELEFRVVATPPTDPGDLDHDGGFDCDDVALLEALLGVRRSDPTYDAYADLDANGIINTADRQLLALLLDEPPADWDGSGGVDSRDFFVFLTDFFGGKADFNSDGVTDSRDFFAFLGAFFGGC